MDFLTRPKAPLPSSSPRWYLSLSTVLACPLLLVDWLPEGDPTETIVSPVLLGLPEVGVPPGFSIVLSVLDLAERACSPLANLIELSEY